MTTLETRT